jgi:hypothetical protein
VNVLEFSGASPKIKVMLYFFYYEKHLCFDRFFRKYY